MWWLRPTPIPPTARPGLPWAAATPLDGDSCVFYGDHGLLDDFSGGVVLETDEGFLLARRWASTRPILKNHGILTAGPRRSRPRGGTSRWRTPGQAQLLAEAAGTLQSDLHDVAAPTHSQLGDGGPSMRFRACTTS